MLLTVTRVWRTDNSTCGMLDIDGVFQAYTLEPRTDQYQGKPYCIPTGTYDLILLPSPHFGCVTPHVQNVPGFSEIEIHWGNFPKDTEGCTLVGRSHAIDFVGESRLAFDALMQKLAGQNSISIVYKDKEN